MKKVLLVAIIGVALTMIGCGDSTKKKSALLAGAALTDTVTDPGTGITPAPTDPSTGDPAATTGMGDGTSATTTGSSGDTTTPGAGTGTTTNPTDTNSDTTSDTGFQYQTIISVTFNLTIMNANNQPIPSASVKVDAGNEDATASVTNADGLAAFKATLKKTDTSVTIVIEHPDYNAKTITVDNIQDLATVTRTIFLEKKAVAQPPAIVDTDGDGVADDLDQYPNDPTLIATVYNEYTIAYEDLYPSKGDADFNDLVVQIGITEYINPQNKIGKINIKSKVLAAGAGYNNKFYIGILGTNHLLIDNPKVDLAYACGYKLRDTCYYYNSNKGETYVSTRVYSKDIVFSTPVSRTAIAPMPYDPYILCNGVTGKESHLPFVATTFTGVRLDSDKFPWAMLIPSTWKWPYEAGSIFNAYPKFKPWYTSDGVQNPDWYLYPESSYVYPAPGVTALTSYLLKVSGRTPVAVIAGLLGLLVMTIVGINIWRRRMQRHDA